MIQIQGHSFRFESPFIGFVKHQVFGINFYFTLSLFIVNAKSQLNVSKIKQEFTSYVQKGDENKFLCGLFYNNRQKINHPGVPCNERRNSNMHWLQNYRRAVCGKKDKICLGGTL